MNDMKKLCQKVVSLLTLEEKISMIHGAGLFKTGSVLRLNIPPLKMSDGPMGVRNEFDNEKWIANGHDDDYVTYLPSNTAIAMTWNTKLAYQAGKVLGEEARGRGKDVILAPGINIKRIPNCGRNFEYISEDPYLNSQMAVEIIKGIQESDVAACVKHFALNSQETQRLWVNVEIDERTLREIYLPAFEAAVKEAGAYSIMGAYNLLRGQHCCENTYLLDEILRKEWNYDGTVISDWGAVHDTKAAAKSSLDIEMSVTPDFDEYCMAKPLIKAIEDGEVKEEWIDEKIVRILLMMIRLNMIEISDGKVPSITRNTKRCRGTYNSTEHRQAAYDVAAESIVLLKNEDEVLPLSIENAKKVLVIGDNAIRRQALGGGSAEIKALYEKTPLLGIKELLGGESEVIFAAGYEVPQNESTDENWQATSLDGTSDDSASQKSGDDIIRERKQKADALRKQAIEQAKREDIDYVIFVGGQNHEQDVEGLDRGTLELPYEQDLLIDGLLNVRPDMSIVMFTGSPVSMCKWSKKAKAVLWMSYSGMEGGTALAHTLFGKINPSGKLTESIPESIEESSGYVNSDYLGRELTLDEQKVMNAKLTQTYSEGLLVGYRYYDRKNVQVQYPFGYGLSYTTFEYGRCSIDKSADLFTLSGKIKNTGAYAGKEIIQVYVAYDGAKEYEPVRQLAGFAKLELLPDETKEYCITLNPRAFEMYDTDAKAWKKVSGKYYIMTGSSSRDIKEACELVVE